MKPRTEAIRSYAQQEYATTPIGKDAVSILKIASPPNRIWDLRRGDDDDNRTSPYGGAGHLVLSTALEFNYLKAPIGFLFLVIVPAILVGIAPSVLYTYGHWMFQAAASTGRSPIPALALLAALVGAALWIGRPLVALAFKEFWHLHYTLVFPMFVALRELLLTIVQGFRRSSMTPEQINQTRRLGTILATLLFGGLALALAIRVEFAVGLRLVDVERVRPLEVVKAALGNAAVVFGLSTAAASLYWLLREFTFRGAVLDWTPDPTPLETAKVRIVHLSDLHLVGDRFGCRMETGTYGPRGNRSIRNALRRLDAIHALNPVDRVVVTGDVTDAGTRAEWLEFLDLLRSHPELRSRMSFVPGNHDVNIVDRTNAGRLDLPWSASQSLRKLRVVLTLDAVQGDRTHVVNRASGQVGALLKDYLREGDRMELLRSLAQRGTWRGRWEMAKVWDAMFPLVELGRDHDSYGVILLNSNAPSHFSLTNAIGVVDPPQLRALKSILQNSPGRAWIILLHHQVVEYPVTSISLRDRIGLALVNAPDVMAAITPYASHILVLHGHRHRDWIGTRGDVVLCSAASAALGSDAEEHFRGCFRIHELAFGNDGSMRLARTERLQSA